ncbi:DapH/DapD/GlmU-related protein [Aeromonas hydrophila]|nr:MULTISPECIES: DapH/DapD/GlmU-related protein [Aeromonas]MDX7672396.1 DapH/DapD/GlmU-related protein [Aeromonas caviae]MDX7866299.1 DapH/DapD/GlmU-related protein [Aeromonas caviae]
MAKDRFIIKLMKIPNFISCRIRNVFFSLGFRCVDLKLGKNVSFTNTKQVFIGDYVFIGNQSWIDAIDSGVIRIGHHVSCSQNVHIASASMVSIGNGCLIGSDVLITDHDHSFSSELLNIMPKNRPLAIKGETIIGENVWIGDNVKILSGVKLGRNVVVAANSVVTHSFHDNVVIAGIPAKAIKTITD